MFEARVEWHFIPKKRMTMNAECIRPMEGIDPDQHYQLPYLDYLSATRV
jgi:hypothetical protein